MTAYATPDDMDNLALPAAALSTLSVEAIQAALDAACAEADSYLAGHYVLPITSWGMDLRQHVCALAAFRALAKRGFNPEAPEAQLARRLFDDALDWFKRVATGVVHPSGLVDSAVTGDDGRAGRPRVVHATVDREGTVTVARPSLRGW